MYKQKFGKDQSDPLADVASKLKEGSGLGATCNNSPTVATMYGAPIHMQDGGSQIGHMSGLNYGSPLNTEGHGAPEGHTHDSENSDRYTYQKAVSTSNKKVSRKARRKIANEVYNANQSGYSAQGYTQQGEGFKVKLGKQPGNNRNLISVSNSRGGGRATYGGDGSSSNATFNEANKNVTKRQIRKQLKKSGSVTVSDGNVTSGTTATVTAGGSVKRDTQKINVANKRKENEAAKLKKAQTNLASRNARKAAIATQKASNLEARKKSLLDRKAKSDAHKAELKNKKALAIEKRKNDLLAKQKNR